MAKRMMIVIKDASKKEGFNLEECLRLSEILEECSMGYGDRDSELVAKLQESFDNVIAGLEE